MGLNIFRSHPLVVPTAGHMRVAGKSLGMRLRVGDVVALVWPLGAGKTTLVQGVVQGWGSRDRAISPTFALVNEYRGPRGTLFHMDLFRLTPKELPAFPLEEYLCQRGVIVIEWADKIRERWPAGTLEIRMRIKGTADREVSFAKPTAAWTKRLRDLV